MIDWLHFKFQIVPSPSQSGSQFCNLYLRYSLLQIFKQQPVSDPRPLYLSQSERESKALPYEPLETYSLEKDATLTCFHYSNDSAL